MHRKCSQCLCLPLLHFAPHASTSQLRNDAGNCVIVPVLIHHVCNECVYAECVSTCLCVRENICWRWVKSLSFCTVHVWDSVDVSVVMLFKWLRVCKSWDLLVAVNVSAFHVLFVCCLVSYGWVHRGRFETDWVCSQVFRLFAEVTSQWFMTGHFTAWLTCPTQDSRSQLANTSDLRTFSSLWEPHTHSEICHHHRTITG